MTMTSTTTSPAVDALHREEDEEIGGIAQAAQRYYQLVWLAEKYRDNEYVNTPESIAHLNKLVDDAEEELANLVTYTATHRRARRVFVLRNAIHDFIQHRDDPYDGFMGDVLRSHLFQEDDLQPLNRLVEEWGHLDLIRRSRIRSKRISRRHLTRSGRWRRHNT